MVVAVTLAVATGATAGGDSQAQPPGAPLASASALGVTVELPPLRVSQPTAPVAPGEVRLPPAPVSPTPLPSAPAVPLPTRSLPAEPPRLPVPSLPKAPSLPVESPALPGDRSLPVQPPRLRRAPDAPARLPSLAGADAPSRLDSEPSPGDGDTSAIASPLTAATGDLERFPSRSELAKLPRAERRALVRATFDTPLRRQRLRQLQTALQEYGGCLDLLSDRGRRALELRAGLLGQQPVSRRVIAHRIGTSPLGVLRLERSSMRRLVGAGERGLCGGGTALGAAATGTAASGATAADPGGPLGERAGADGRTAPRPAGEVLADVHEGGPGIDLGDGQLGAAETLLFFLATALVLLGPLAAIAAAVQRRAGGAAAAADTGERPLLFLDVDGVIVLDPLEDGLPPGRIRSSPFGLGHVPDRIEQLAAELATRFDIVWTTGWEHHANYNLLGALGLHDELPVLTFGKHARTGSSKWKIKPVDHYAGDRPAAWLDDNFVGRHERWAAHRSAPTLLVRVDPSCGLAPEHVERLTRWADRLASSQAEARPNGRRRMPAS